MNRVPEPTASQLLEKLQHEKPAGSEITPDKKQIFILKSAQVEDLYVVPVVYQPHGRTDQPAQCGVYFFAKDGHTQYLPVINLDLRFVDMCQDVEGLGTMADPGPRPRLLAAFAVNSGHGPDNTLTYVLRWNESAAMYQVDSSASEWLNRQKGSGTIVGARKLLAGHR